jgi:anti-anti-sigma regulatory factor
LLKDEGDTVLRITAIQANGSPVTLKLEGKILAEGVPLLERECEERLAKRDRVVLDLSQVTFVDRSGIQMLQRVSARSVSIVNGSAFIAELLDEGGQS